MTAVDYEFRVVCDEGCDACWDRLPSHTRASTQTVTKHLRDRDDAAALAQLLQAERTGPEDLRYNDRAHEVIRDVLTAARPRTAERARHLAKQLGLTE